MKNGLSKFLLLLAVFFAAFLTVIVVRKTQNGASFLDFFKDREHAINTPTGPYTLREKPPIDLSDVKVLAAINDESAALVRAVVPSVVSIDTSTVRHERHRDFRGRTWVQPRAVQGQGSGVIVTKEGHVITNYHVIQGNPSIRLTMHNGQIYTAKIIGADPTVDIAVLKINAAGPFVPLKFGDSEKIEVGNIVFAIGSPFGLGESVTDGRISAKKRSFSDSQVDLLQTSAAINPGNSGGPLVNIQGEIIGINSRIYSTDKRNPNPGFQGISFAIPSNAALKTMRSILARDLMVRGFLGMALDNLSPAARREFAYSKSGGVRIVGLAPDAPAIKAGLKTNDIIIRFDGHAVSGARQLISFIQQSTVGAEIPLEIWRDQKTHTITTTIGDAEKFNRRLLNQKVKTTPQKAPPQVVLRAIGLIVRNPTSNEKQQSIHGVFIEKILPESQLKGRLITGDLIRSINGQPVQDQTDFFKRLVDSVSTQNTDLIIQRGKNTIELTLSPLRK